MRPSRPVQAALIALIALAPLADGAAQAQNFRGGGFGGGGFHGGGFGFELGFGGGGLGGLGDLGRHDDAEGRSERSPHNNSNGGQGGQSFGGRSREPDVSIDGGAQDTSQPHRSRTPVHHWTPPSYTREDPVPTDQPYEPAYRAPHPHRPVYSSVPAPVQTYEPVYEAPRARTPVYSSVPATAQPYEPVYEAARAHKPSYSPAPPPLAYARPPLPPPPKPAVATLPARAALPPAGETRYRAGEVLVEIAATTPEPQIAAALARHRLTQIDAAPIALLGLSLRRWKTNDARGVAALVDELGSEAALVRVQPNYLYAPADDAAPPRAAVAEAAPTPSAPEQYSLVKMHVAPSLEDPASAIVRVAVIDTAIDEQHPDLKGAVDQSYDAIGDGSRVRNKEHGTAMAGGIAANGKLRGVATHVKLLSARAFDVESDALDAKPLGSTFSVLKALQWSADQKAQVVNMSFAGPNDPALRDGLAAASARGMVLVSAAGNLGPSAPAQYPGADAHVIAATATDADDKRYAGANVGAYVAISAPGVDVLLPAPEGGYAMETGTSVSSALVAGVAALMLEKAPGLKPDEVRARLIASARPLGARPEFGAGLVDAQKAVAR